MLGQEDLLFKQAISACVLAIVMLLQGCASIDSIIHHRAGSADPLVFGGTRHWIEYYSGETDSEGIYKNPYLALYPPLKLLRLIPVFDSLFSFVADTALLPITFPWALSEEVSTATISERFDQKIKDIQDKCSSLKLRPGVDCARMANLKPFDQFDIEEGRFAASLKIPNAVPVEGGYRPGMNSREYFEHLCKTEAGEFIYKSIEKIEGLFLMRPRINPVYEYAHLYAPEDPYGLWGYDDLRPESLGGPSRYAFVEAVAGSEKARSTYSRQERSQPANARYVRYRVEWRQTSWQMKPSEYDIKLKSRYGFTWRGITRPHDRELGIAGSEVIVLDLMTQEVLGVYRGYARFDFTKQVRNEVGMAWVDRCPDPSRKTGSGPQKEFVYKVLHP